jgi:hypothetical protein
MHRQDHCRRYPVELCLHQMGVEAMKELIV